MPIQNPRERHVVSKEEVPSEEESQPDGQATKSAQEAPQIGQIVHYVMDDGKHHSAHRPALIVSVEELPAPTAEESDVPPPEPRVNLVVFTDGHNDFERPHIGASGILWKTEVRRDETTKYPNSYHTPEI